MSFQQDLISFFSTLGVGTLTVTRTATGSRTKGLYTPGATSTFSIVASVQPVSGDEVKDLQEAQDADEIKSFWTITELRGRTPSTEPDLVTLEGRTWQVIKVTRWDAFDATHYIVYVARLNPATVMFT